MRPKADVAAGRRGVRLRASTKVGGVLCTAAMRKVSPSRRYRFPKLASQMRVAFASIAENTGSSSPGELEITRSTSEVAVCCSSASVKSFVRWRSSFSKRVFSMAMTACAAKFFSRSICLSVNGHTSWRLMVIAPISSLSVLEHGDAERRPITAKLDRGNDKGIAFEVGRYHRDVGNVDHLLRGGDTPKRRVRGRPYQLARARLHIRRGGIVSSNRAEAISLADVQRADLRLADAHGVRKHGLEDRLQPARRGREDL